MKAVVTLLILITACGNKNSSIAASGTAPYHEFPLLPFTDFILHSSANRHLYHFQRLCQAEVEWLEMLVEGSTGGFVIVPVDSAWKGDLSMDRDHRRPFLMSRFVHLELKSNGLQDGREILRLTGINAKYVFIKSRGRELSKICLTPTSFRPVNPRLLSCARVITTRVFSDLQALFVDGLLLEHSDQDEAGIEDGGGVGNEESLLRDS